MDMINENYKIREKSNKDCGSIFQRNVCKEKGGV